MPTRSRGDPVAGYGQSRAWLMAVGKRRLIEQLRRADRLTRNVVKLGRDLETSAFGRTTEIEDGHIEDVLLRPMFVACHPLLSAGARVALTLRLVGGPTR